MEGRESNKEFVKKRSYKAYRTYEKRVLVLLKPASEFFRQPAVLFDFLNNFLPIFFGSRKFSLRSGTFMFVSVAAAPVVSAITAAFVSAIIPPVIGT